MERFDLIVLGTGQGGSGPAHRCRKAGWGRRGRGRPPVRRYLRSQRMRPEEGGSRRGLTAGGWTDRQTMETWYRHADDAGVLAAMESTTKLRERRLGSSA